MLPGRHNAERGFRSHKKKDWPWESSRDRCSRGMPYPGLFGGGTWGIRGGAG